MLCSVHLALLRMKCECHLRESEKAILNSPLPDSTVVEWRPRSICCHRSDRVRVASPRASQAANVLHRYNKYRWSCPSAYMCGPCVFSKYPYVFAMLLITLTTPASFPPAARPPSPRPSTPPPLDLSSPRPSRSAPATRAPSAYSGTASSPSTPVASSPSSPRSKG